MHDVVVGEERYVTEQFGMSSRTFTPGDRFQIVEHKISDYYRDGGLKNPNSLVGCVFQFAHSHMHNLDGLCEDGYGYWIYLKYIIRYTRQLVRKDPDWEV